MQKGFNNSKKIYMSKGYFPDEKNFNSYLSISKESGFITNNGPLLKNLELRISNFLNVENVIITSSGTTALIVLIKALLKDKQEIITTPFTFAATSSSVFYGGGIPIFADVKEDFPSLSPKAVKKAIGPNTGAILATQVYGYPCEHEELNKIAKQYSIPLIYDCAHGFGIVHKSRPLLSYGKASICSFHETKAFSCGEGGAIITCDNDLAERCKEIRNFSLNSESLLIDLDGINAKMSEFHAALGHCNLDEYHDKLLIRKKIFNEYEACIGNRYLEKIRPCQESLGEDFKYNYSYYPLLIKNNNLNYVLNKLKEEEIYAKRYFYPSLDTLYKSEKCPISNKFAESVLCIPCHSQLKDDEVLRIKTCLSQIDKNL